LVSLLEDLSRALDRTAELAEEHAARAFRDIDDATRELELERAHQAREYAQRARVNADRLRRYARAPAPLPRH
jgi:hypothetical protein